jgi:hypothetical protein
MRSETQEWSTDLPFFVAGETVHELHHDGISLSGKRGFVVVSVCRRPNIVSATITGPSSEEPAVPVAQTSRPSSAPYVTPASNAIGDVTTNVPVAVEQARTATAKLKSYHGTAMDNIAAVTTSDLCGTILGYVDRVVQFGDKLSQVRISVPVFNHH